MKGVSHNNPGLAIVSSIVRQNMHSRGMPPLCSKTGGATKVKPRMTAKAHELAAKQIRVFPTGTEALAHTDQVGEASHSKERQNYRTLHVATCRSGAVEPKQMLWWCM